MNKKRVLKGIGLFVMGVAVGAVASKILSAKKVEELFKFTEVPVDDMSDVIKEIKVYTRAGSSDTDVCELIHDQLRGNQDYIDCDIILNDDVVIQDGVTLGRLITYTVYKESKSNPNIKLDI